MIEASLFVLLAQQVVALLVQFLLLPYLGAYLMSRWFEKAKIPGFPLKRCAQAYCITVSVAMVVLMILNLVLTRRGGLDDQTMRITMFLSYVTLQLVLVPLLLRNFTASVLRVEIGSIVVANVIANSVIFLLLSTDLKL